MRPSSSSYRSAGAAGGPGVWGGGAGGGGAREGTGDRGRGGDERRDQVRPPALALPALEVAVRGGRAALARRELVGIHAEAHRATRLAPVGAGRGEDRIESLGLSLLAYPHRAGDHQQPHAVRDLVALEDLGRGAEVLDPAVRARAD